LKGGIINFSEKSWYNFISSLVIQAVWSNMHDFSFLILNTMVAMKTPGVSEMIQAVLLNIIQADILMTDKWL